MTIIDDQDDTRRGARSLGARDVAPRAGGTRPASPASGRRTSRTRSAAWAGMLGPMWVVLVFVVDRSRSPARRSTCFGPRVLGHGTDIIVRGVHTRPGMDFAALHRVLLQALGLYAASSLLSIVGRLHARGRHPAADVQAALRRRGQGQRRCRSATSTSRPRGDLLSRVTNDIDNVAQSLQQTLSQMLTSVLLLVGVAIMMFTISPLLAVVALTTVPVSVWAMRAVATPRPAPLHLAVEEHRDAQRADRGDVHGSRGREGVRPSTRGRAAVPRDQRRALRVVVRRAVHVEPDAALHDVHGQRPVRDRRGRRRPAGGERRDQRRRHPGLHPVLPQLLDAAHAARVDDERVPVGHRLVRAGGRVPRRRRAESRPRDRATTRRRCAAASSSATSRSPTTRTGRSSSRCRSWPSPARRSRSSGRPARARPRSSTSSCASTS